MYAAFLLLTLADACHLPVFYMVGWQYARNFLTTPSDSCSLRSQACVQAMINVFHRRFSRVYALPERFFRATSPPLAHPPPSFRCVESLVAAGSNIDAQGKYGNTALHWAAVGGRVECVEALIRLSANKGICNHNGRTARDLATAKGQTAVEHLLGDALWSNDVRELHASLEKRVQEALDELRLGREDEPDTRNLPPDNTDYTMDDNEGLMTAHM